MSRTVSGQTPGGDEPRKSGLRPTQVLLSEEQRAWLDRVGKRRYRSMGAQIRDLIDEARERDEEERAA